MIDDAKENLGVEMVDSILNSFGIQANQLEDETAWVSLQFAETMMTKLAEAYGGPEFLHRAFRLAYTTRYGGAVLPIFKAFGSPAFTLNQVVRMGPRFQKIWTTDIMETRPGFVRMRMRRREGAPEISSYLMCYGSSAQYAAIPTMFGLPPAKVEHSACTLRGDEACIFDIYYQEPAKQYWSRIGFVVGAAVSSLTLWGLDQPYWYLLAFGLSLGAWALGRVVELKRDIAQLVEDIATRNEALERSARANEERFNELLEAKAQVEEKVEQRTAELRKTSQRLAQTLERVQALSNAKAEFFANISHDLRTPLTLITAPLDDLVVNREPPGGSRAALEAMHRNANRLLALINQLLDLSKLDAGAVELKRSMVDLAQLCREIVESFDSAARLKKIDLQFQAPPTLERAALDPVWIESILSNLVINALRFVDSGGQICVRLFESDSHLLIEVQDNGHGISPTDLPHVFDRYRQAGHYRTRRGGSGIGLALVREAARLHGGEVWVKSEIGQGTLFTVQLPKIDYSVVSEDSAGRSRAYRKDIDGVIELFEGERSDVEDHDRAGPSPDAPLVLVVEDDPDTRRFVADVLAVRYRVRAASNGEEAYNIAEIVRPDAVITDLDMPKMNGLALCHSLRAVEQCKKTPILLLTAMGDPKSVIKGFDAGADDYVTKPFHGRELLARLEVHLRLRHLVSEIAHNSRLAMLGVAAASVAHNVRNPLNAISSGLDTMLSRSKAANSAEYRMLSTMIDCTQKIEQITTDLLNLSRIDRAREDKWRVATDLTACVRMIMVRLPANVILDTEIDEDAAVDGRPGDLNHVFLNLLDNAIRAVGERGRITLHAKQENGALCVAVADSGPGVDLKIRERIFQPFFTTRVSGQGTGLGLSIAKQVIEQHGGAISVSRSEELGGALFLVRIPTSKG